MKKIFSMFALLLALSLFLTGCGSTLIENLDEKNILGAMTTENDVAGRDYELLLEDEKIQFYMNPNTTEIKVVNKKDKSVWTSTNPGTTDDASKALLHLEYTTTAGVTNQINSYESAVVNGQYKIVPEDNKVSVSYSIGNFTSQVMVPELLTPERYEELMNRFTGDLVFDQSKFRNYYTLFDIKEMQTDDVYVADTIEKYPILEEKVMYVVSQTVLTNAVAKKDFATVLQNIGYSKEEYEKDSANFTDASNTIEEAGFNITLEFSVEDGELILNIPNDKIEMYADFPLTNIIPLKYFGSQTHDSKGYFVLPDGSGSVMNFYNGKADGHPFTTRVYGTGYALSQGEKTNDYKDASLPIYGISCGKTALFAEIIKGDSIADVHAYSGDDSDVAYVTTCFRFRETFISRLSSGRKEAFSTIQKARFPGDMAIRYSFLNGSDASYSGMAKFYRQRLFKNETPASDNISVIIEYVGMIEKQSQMMGISYDKEIVLTKFDEVGKYATELKDEGIDNLNIKLTGWFGKGYNHGSTSSVDPVSALGGLKGFNDLSKKLSSNGINFWPDVDIQYTLDNSIGSQKKAIRTIDKSIGKTYEFDMASFNKTYTTASRRVNTLSVIKEELNSFVKFADENSLKTLSLRSIGKGVNADFNEEGSTDQQTTMNETVAAIKKIKEGGKSFITSGSNAYILKLADMCLDTPLTSNEYDATDYSIPFLQMVIRGNVEYAGDPINLTGDTDVAVLTAAQTGANLYYTFAAQNAREVANSNFSNLYSIDYSYHKDSMIKTVKKYQSDFAVTAGQTIKDFKVIEPGFTKTVFSNGSVSYVNMNNYAVKFEGIKLEAKSYLVKKG